MTDVAVILPVGPARARGAWAGGAGRAAGASAGSDVLARIAPSIARGVGALIMTVDPALHPAALAAVRRVVRSHPQLPLEVLPVAATAAGELAAFALAAERGLRIAAVIGAAPRRRPDSVARLLRPLVNGRADVVATDQHRPWRPWRLARRPSRDYGIRLDRLGLDRLRAAASTRRLVTDVVTLATTHRLRLETVTVRRRRRHQRA